jgi:hypothetical protein
VSTDGKLSHLSEALGSNAQAVSGISGALPDLVSAMGSIGNAFADATSSVRQLTETTASIAESGSIDDHKRPRILIVEGTPFGRPLSEVQRAILGRMRSDLQGVIELRSLSDAQELLGIEPNPDAWNDAWREYGRKLKTMCLFRHTALRRGKKFIYYT